MKNLKRFLSILVLLVMVVPTSCLADADGSYVAMVTCDTTVYTTPWIEEKNLTFGVIPAGSNVTILSETDDWYAISWNGGSGFLRKTAWTTEPNENYPQKGVIDPGKKVWLRAEASKDGKKYVVWYEGTEVIILGDKVYNEAEDEWYYPVQYELKEGQFVTAYITSRYISILN